MERGSLHIIREGPKGPYYNHQCYENGKHVSRYVPQTEVPQIQEAIESNLTSIAIPNSVTNLGSSAFSDCEGLTSLTLGNGLASLENSVFSCCFNLTEVIIPNSVTNIGDSAFWGCNLISVQIPDGVINIGDSAFSDFQFVRV